MKEIVSDPKLVARCGLYCGACGAYLKGRCPGCAGNEKATWCGVRSCCLERGFATCADCKEFADPRNCGKFNNFVSKVFGFLFRSNRPACIDQVRRLGVQGHADEMTKSRRQSMKR
jgi:hypothetical protein